MVLDAHTHAWGAPSPAHPWTNGPLVETYTSQFSTNVVYTADRLQEDMDAAGVDEAVVVGYPITDWTDNWYTIEAASRDGLYGVGMLDVFAEDAPERLRELMAQDGVIGVRLGAVCPYDEMWERFDYDVTWLRESIEETAFWRAARETDALIQILAHTSQLDQALALLETYPDLPVVFDHFAHADASEDPAAAYAGFEALADFDRVGIKISEVAHLSNEDDPYEDTHDHLRWLLETLGPERVIWGSDFPNVSHPDFGGMTYPETRSWLDAVPFLSERDRAWLTGRAVRDLAEL